MAAMRVATALGVGLAALVLTAGSANAIHWWCERPPTVDLGGAAYVVWDNWPDCVTGCYIFSLWVYAESNRDPGLQRGGLSPLGDADLCQNSKNPDFLVF